MILRERSYLRNQMDEGINDPHIFKAIFMAGGSGSGKSHWAKHMFAGMGLKFINSDSAFEKYLKRLGITTKMAEPDENPELYNTQMSYRDKAKNVTKMAEPHYLSGMLGLIFDGTGRRGERMKKQVKMLRKLGYDVAMVFIDTPQDLAFKQNQERDRVVTKSVAADAWQGAQKNLQEYRKLFGPNNFFYVQKDQKWEGDVEQKMALKFRRWAMKWLARPIKNPVGKAKVKRLREIGGKSEYDL